MQHLQSVAEHDQLVADSKIVVVKYGAVWCRPCVTLGAELAKMASEFESVTFASVDIDKIKHFQGCKLPTTRIYKGGEEIDMAIGGSAASFIHEILEEMAAHEQPP